MVKSGADKGSVRIIAGQWRSRRLPVVNVAGLRPSGDRCRETLFNWLQAFIPGANCADLFAGTGALGFEAASRGAASVTLVEQNTNVVRHLRESAALLEADQLEIIHGDALAWLDDQSADSFSIIFVDPPFQQQMHNEVLSRIEKSGCLKQGGLVYVESPASQAAPQGPAGWTSWREKVIGEIRLQVFRR